MTAILASNPRYLIYIRYWLRKINRRLHLKQLWYQDNGNWHWIKEKATPVASLNRRLWRLSVPSFSFHFMLGLSAIISTLGLLANSVAVIIGAMIIAPLMGPIVGMAFSVAMGNRKLLRRSSLTLLKGVILTILLSWLTAWLIGLKTVDSEIISRTNPTLIDLGIAMAAGMAGAFANTRRLIADALPGVAITVALVPPLSVVGIGLALGEQEIALGSSLLFLTNLICIIFFGALVFLFQSYGSIQRAKRPLALSIVFMFLLAIPLTLSMRKLIIEKNLTSKISDLIVGEAVSLSDVKIKKINVIPKKGYLHISIEVTAPFESIAPEQIESWKDRLSQNISQPIDLEVEIIPVKTLKSSELNFQ